MNIQKHLVPDWRDAWRFASVQATAIGGTLAATAAAYPDLIITLSAMLGGTPRLQAAIVAFVLVVIALRLWNQEDADEE